MVILKLYYQPHVDVKPKTSFLILRTKIHKISQVYSGINRVLVDITVKLRKDFTQGTAVVAERPPFAVDAHLVAGKIFLITDDLHTSLGFHVANVCAGAL